MNIGEGQRWKPADPQYIKTLEYMNTREYRQALEHLHKLVIQRLYELHCLNLSQTGYKMRTHIANALQRRLKAICRAVKRYNNAAMSLKPPRPTLDWSRVSHFSFLDQFNILQDTQHSVLEKPWAKPVIRELMKKYHRVSCAQEEVIRCNVELHYLHTSIVDEDRHFKFVLIGLQSHSMYGPVHEYIQRRRRINQYILQRIQDTYNLEGFSGTPTPGVRKGSETHTSSPLNVPASSATSYSPRDPPCDDKEQHSDDNDVQDNDNLNEGVASMIDFISNLSVHG
ncbi:hypothetical protein VKT23_017895 [Stygiomarasmius scandens]|uniref:Uncharacterized protein n=1 Tax=Marasmiellus scandens TaxID=2682957 RepID=A0ABR1IT08_9AGAR